MKIKFINIPCNFSIKYCYRGFQEIQITEIKKIQLLFTNNRRIHRCFSKIFSITQGDSIIHIDISEISKKY